MTLSNNHWTIESYTQRMTVKDWKKILLDDRDHPIVAGRLRQLEAKRLGVGVVEVYKVPLKD